MWVFEMVVIIVIASLVAGLIKDWLKTKQQKQVDIKPLEDRLEYLENLEERVKVLEAIVTDKGYDLKSEIERL